MRRGSAKRIDASPGRRSKRGVVSGGGGMGVDEPRGKRREGVSSSGTGLSVSSGLMVGVAGERRMSIDSRVDSTTAMRAGMSARARIVTDASMGGRRGVTGRERGARLHAAALRARREALAVLGEDGKRFGAAVERYVNAVEAADAARREWERLGRPLSARGSAGQESEHPLVRTMDRMDAAASRFGSLLGLDPVGERRVRSKPWSPPVPGRGRGRPAGSASAPDRRDDGVAAPPLVRLRVAR